jgi:molybdopterin molybdotransferase
VIADDLLSPLSIPSVDRSERDGFALRSAETAAAPTVLQLVGSATAGTPFVGELLPGACVRIATGATLPADADAVVMFEECSHGGSAVTVSRAIAPAEWIGKAGSDLRKGGVVIPALSTLAPPTLAAAAALGVSELRCLRRPRVMVYTTGNEVRSPGESLREGDVFDGISVPLIVLLRSLGCDAHFRQPVRDTLEAQREVLAAEAKTNDMVIFTGGTSVGEKDFGRLAMDAEGATLIHGVDIKPGRPMLFGRVGSTPVFGLPGFPVSALTLAYSFLVPAVRQLSGARSLPRSCRAKLAEPLRPDPKVTFVVPVALSSDGLARSTFRGSGHITTISTAIGLVCLAPGTAELPAGTDVEVQLL